MKNQSKYFSLALVILFGCTENIQPQKEVLTKQLLVKEVSKLNSFGLLVSAQKTSFEAIQSLTRAQKDRLLVIQANLGSDFR